LTFRELDQATDRIAAALRRRGVRPRSKVAWLLSNDRGGEALLLYHAVLKAGAVNVPINTRLTPAEIKGLVEHSRSETVVAEPRLVFGLADVGVPPRCRLLDVEAETRGGLFDVASESNMDSSADHEVSISEDALACILYTSGTTGMPKGVEHTHASSLAAGISWSDAFMMTRSDIVQSPFPIYSGAGLHFNGLAAMWSSAAFVVDGTDVEDALARIERCRATIYVAVPSIYQYWLAHPALTTRDLRSLRILCYGGATMPTGVILELRQAFPHVDLMQTYGSTEAGPGGTYLPPAYATERLGSIGSRPAGRFSRFRVVDGEGSEVAPGELGELLMSGPSMMRGYHRDPAATADVLKGGWVRSGDLVRYDEEGFLYFVDRKRDIIVRGGLNISTFEVEEALLQHPAVAEGAAFAGPHAQLGEEVRAAVVLRPDMNVQPEELIVHCRSLLADFKVPRRIEIRDALPRNASGKVLKRILASESRGADAPNAVDADRSSSKRGSLR
jgi:acyl-CoA synthetase (AMP-forming)/AMP-acid ligase II